MAEEYKAAEVIKAIQNAQGVIRYAAKALGCSRQTVYNYINKYPTVKQAHENAGEDLIDWVETSLLKKIEAGDTTATIFFLKTRAKHRGYSERTEVTGKDGGAMTIRIVRDASVEPEHDDNE